MAGKQHRDWTREEHILAFNLYCKIPFGRQHSRAPEVIHLAEILHRSPNSVAMKLNNMARLDPELKARGIKGLSRGAKGEEEVWNEFEADPEALSYESQRLLAQFTGRKLEEIDEIDERELPKEGLERERMVRVRVNQHFFRAAVLSAYDNKCCVTGLAIPELLVASHIVPWATDAKQRMNPRNGLCLNALHDRAFDRGLMFIDEARARHSVRAVSPLANRGAQGTDAPYLDRNSDVQTESVSHPVQQRANNHFRRGVFAANARHPDDKFPRGFYFFQTSRCCATNPFMRSYLPRVFTAGFFLAVLPIISQIQAAPINDLFANRITLVGTNVTVQSSNGGANTEPGEPTGGGCVAWYYSIWYSWTAPTGGVVRFSGSTTLSSFILSVRAYRGTAVNALTAAPTTLDGGVPVVAGDTIAIQVGSISYPCGGGSAVPGSFTMNLQFDVPAPTSPNDAFSNRIEITNANYHFDGSIYGATNEPGEPLPAPNTRQTLWWKITPAEDGLFPVTVSSPQFSSFVRLYEGTQVNSLSPVTSVVGSLYQLQGGHAYALQMASDYVPSGAFALDTRFYPLAYDTFAQSQQVDGTNIAVSGNFGVATLEPGEPQLARSNTVWVSWAAPFTGRVLYSLATAPQFQFVFPYTGQSVDNLQPVTTVPLVNRVNSFLAMEGTVYHFQFSGDDYYDFNFSLSLQPFGPASNDNFANAELIKGRNFTTAAASVNDATVELGEPAHLGATPVKSLWWKWQSPQHGTFSLQSYGSLVPNMVLAIYQGSSVATLQLLAKGTNNVSFPVTGGNYYYIAGLVPTNAMGDVAFYGQGSVSTTPRTVPGNLLLEPSWEGTGVLNAQHWSSSGSLGGYVNEQGGVDGTTWPSLSGGTKIWQDITTIPGQNHLIKFAYRIGGSCCGDVNVRVYWGTNVLGVADIPAAESGYWHWATFTAIASNTTSRVTFENLARNVEMDAFSVVSLTDPPSIVTQPSSISTLAGGAAAFICGVSGSSPLSYKWFHNGVAFTNLTTSILELTSVSTNQAGSYFVVVTNAYGSVTSAPATLTVQAPTDATIFLQPYGDTLPVGSFYNLSVVAGGTAPLTYQWYVSNQAIADATNRNLTFTNIQLGDAGVYQVRVQNAASTVFSLPATLNVTNFTGGGGMLYFRNRISLQSSTNDFPIFDLDGVTRLAGTNYLAQLYAGPSLEQMRAVGQPSVFQTGFNVGFFVPQTITLPTVSPGSNAVVQVRAWDRNFGETYEEARARGGKFGKSVIRSVLTGGNLVPPQFLIGLQSFSLQAGLPQFITGRIHFVERESHGVVVWAHEGEPGFRYLIEKTKQDFVWQPFVIVTNVTSTVPFTDTANSGAHVVLYRSRILD